VSTDPASAREATPAHTALAGAPPARARLRRYAPLLLLPVVAAVGLLGSQPWTMTLVFACLWAMYAVGYDLFSGYSGRVNLGYAMFPGVAGYVTAILSTRLHFPALVSVACGILAAVLLALVVGALTLRIQGIYFSLATAIVPLALFQLTHVLGRALGGEEGIWGVPPFFLDPRLDLLVVLLLLGGCVAFALWFANSKAGLVLRAIKGSDLTSQALGIDRFRFLLVGFLVSAAFGGIGGAYSAHFQMFVGPDLLFIITTLQVITFTIVGGPATIVGPMVGAFALVIVNEYLRNWTEVRLFAYFVVLVLLLRFSPDGIIVPAARALRNVIASRSARGRTGARSES
jgi:branched-chain amino acid transport system permease protein